MIANLQYKILYQAQNLGKTFGGATVSLWKSYYEIRSLSYNRRH